MTTHVTNQSGAYSSAIGNGGTASVFSLYYWVGVRTPQSGTGLQVRVETTDSLGSVTTQYSAILDGSASGSIQGNIVYHDQSGGTVYVDVFGTPSPAYDVLWDERS